MSGYCFYDDALPEWGIDAITIAEDRDGALYFPVKVLCAALALDRGSAVAFLHEDSRTAPGMKEIRVPSRGGAQSTTCVRRRELAIWLAVIDPRRIGPKARACGRLQEFQEALWQLADRVMFRGKMGADATAVPAPVAFPLEGIQRAPAHCPDCGAPILIEVERGEARVSRR